MMAKSRCTLYREVCSVHGYQHGAEAEVGLKDEERER
jgi:hypothetical protein